MIHFHRLPILPVLLLAMASASPADETRMQVAVPSTPLRAQPSDEASPLGRASSGDILFVTRTQGDWAAVSPPDHIGLWLNTDFIEGNRVLARSIQIRSGPGIQHDVVGTLERGALVMPRKTEGDWTQIAPPSSTTLWVKKNDLADVRTRTEPAAEVAKTHPPEPAQPAPAPTPAPAPARPKPPAPAPAPAAPAKIEPPAPTPIARPEPGTETVLPLAQVPAPAPSAPAPARITPSSPQTAPARTRTVPNDAARRPVPSSMPTAAAPARPVANAPAPMPASRPAAPRPTLRPATAIPASTPPPVIAAPALPPSAPAPPPATRQRRAPAILIDTPPAPASSVSSHRSRDVAVSVDPDLVEDLDLIDSPNQGAPVQVEGELRAAPFLAASPSRYRLLAYDGNILEMVCHVHGASVQLRQFIGKGVSIRGREYWVEKSDMPVVVVGQIVPLAPANEPVMF